MPSALVITAAGINCDRELAHAFQLAGAEVENVHVHTLIDDDRIVDRFDLIGVPGGFSYGDAIAAGRVLAMLMRRHLYHALVRAIERGVPIFAPCNGFQIVCQMGLLPGPDDEGSPWPTDPPRPTVALAQNVGGRFVDRWSRVTFPPSRSIWTRELEGDASTLLLPSAHGEGRFVVDDSISVDRLREAGRIAIEYHPQDNFNGSVASIAGICDRTGLVLGLMPHPERYTRWEQHPYRTRLDPGSVLHDPIGLQMFRNAVTFVEAKSQPAAV